MIKNIISMVELTWASQPLCFMGLVAIELVRGLLPPATAWVTKVLFDLLVQVLGEQSAARLHQNLFLALAVLALLSVLNELSTPVHSFLTAELGRSVTLNTQNSIYKKINGLAGIAPFENPRLHNMIQFAAETAQYGPIQNIRTLSSLLQNTITIVAFVGILVSFSPFLMVVVVLASIPQLYAQLKISRQRFDVAHKNVLHERKASYYSLLLSGLEYAREMRLFNLSSHFLRAFEHVTRKVHKSVSNQQLREMRFQLAFTTFTSVAASIAFAVVVLTAIARNLSIGSITLYVNAFGSLQGAFSAVVFAFSELREGLLFYNHYCELLKLPEPLKITNPPRPVPPLKKGIELVGVSFRYSEQHEWILRDVNLFIPASQRTALVGPNGAGKTTLVKLLTRLYDPVEGQILWDRIDIKEFDPVELRSHIGAICQDFKHYDLSVKENIGVGDTNHCHDGARIQNAAEHAGIHTTIDDLPHKYESILSRWLAEDDVGVELSGGQWQKIAMARMFMRDVHLRVLDEPTSALDPEAEHEIYKHFLDLTNGPTVLLITHRFSTVRMADIIAVLADCRIAEYGTHDELLALNGTYAKLYNMQSAKYR